jgi:hypothetical protein
MDLTKLALIAQMIDSAEKSIQSAKQMMREAMGGIQLNLSVRPETFP